MSRNWDPRGEGVWRSDDGRWQVDRIKYPNRTVFLLSKIEFGVGSTKAVVDSFWDARQKADEIDNSRERRAAVARVELREAEARVNAREAQASRARADLRDAEQRLYDARNAVRALERNCC